MPLPTQHCASSSTPATWAVISSSPTPRHSYLRAFALTVPSAWNALPPNTAMAPSLWIMLL